MYMHQPARSLLRLSIACLLLLAISNGNASPSAAPLVNADRLQTGMARMQSFRRDESAGADRLAYSVANRNALRHLATLMQRAGMMTHIDPAGNLVGRAEGRQALPPLLLGSHIDTAPNGAHCAGSAGVIAAIEVARTLHHNGMVPEHPLEIVVWSNSEGGASGSRSYGSTVDVRERQPYAPDGRTIADGIRFLGGNPQRIRENRRAAGAFAAYLELQVAMAGLPRERSIGVDGVASWNVAVGSFDDEDGDRLQAVISAAAGDTRLTFEALTSGAAADARNIARLAPAAVILVPRGDHGSRSSCAAAASTDIADGANLLLRSILALDSWHQVRKR